MRYTAADQRLCRRAFRAFVGVAMVAAVLFCLAVARPTPAHAFILGADGVGIDFSMVDLDRHEYRIGINYYAFMSSRPDGLRPVRRRYDEDCEEGDEVARPAQEQQYAVNISKETIEGVVGDTLYWPECQWLVFDFSFDAEPRVREEIRKRMRAGKSPFTTLHLTGQRALEDERDIVVTSFPDSLSVRVGIRTTSRWVGGRGAKRLSVGSTNGKSKVHWRLRPAGIQFLSLGFPYTVEDREEILFALRDYRKEMDERASLPEYGRFESFVEADELTRKRIRTEVWHEFVQASFNETEPRSPATVARKHEVAVEEAAAEAQRRADAEAERLAEQRAQEEKERLREQEITESRAELAELRAKVARLERDRTQPAPAAQPAPAPAPVPAAKPAKVAVPIRITGYRPDKRMRLTFRCGGQITFSGQCHDLEEDGRSGDGKYRTYRSTINLQLEEGVQTLDFELEYDYQGGRRTAYDRFTVTVSKGMAPYPVPITESGRR